MVKSTPSQAERGQILILTALSLTVLLGIAALSIDASFMYDKRSKLYAAADAAAKSAAAEVHRRVAACNEPTTLQHFGDQQATMIGFSPGAPTSVVMHCPPSSGPFAANQHYVEAIVTESTNTFFGHIVGWASLTPGARAVAGTSPGPACIVVLGGPGASEPLMTLQNNAHLNMPLCSVVDRPSNPRTRHSIFIDDSSI